MADSTRPITDSIVITLTVEEDGTAVAADSIPTAEVVLREQVVQTATTADVSNPSTGVYTFALSPTETGVHTVTWSWTRAGENYESEFTVDITANPEGTVEDNSAASSPSSAPDIGTANTCTVTATFYDGGGNGMEGVYVRFTPLRGTDSVFANGMFVQEVTASSDEDGALSLTLVRGVLGTLSVSGLGIVRQVRVPDVAATTLNSLIALGDDLLEVQTPKFTRLPRRS